MKLPARRLARAVARGIVDPVLYRVHPQYVFYRARRDWNHRAVNAPKETTATFDASDWETYWASGSRDLEVLLELAQQAGCTSRELAVEIGCGLGRVARPLAARFRKVLAVDISQEMLRQAAQLAGAPNIDYELVVADHRLHLKDGSADLVIAWTVFRHTSKSVFDAYLKEARRILKTGGCLVFEMQVRQTGAVVEPQPYDSLTEREYTRAELVNYSAHHGFRLGAERASFSVAPGTITLILAWVKQERR
jgi:ubiquinone/menaquinone biosynthesis C-methylase UbiE